MLYQQPARCSEQSELQTSPRANDTTCTDDTSSTRLKLIDQIPVNYRTTHQDIELLSFVIRHVQFSSCPQTIWSHSSNNNLFKII